MGRMGRLYVCVCSIYLVIVPPSALRVIEDYLMKPDRVCVCELVLCLMELVVCGFGAVIRLDACACSHMGSSLSRR